MFLVIFVSITDYLTGYEIQFAIFHLIPIVFVTWFTGKESSELISLVCIITTCLADMLAGKVFLYLLIWFWDTLAVLGFYLIVVLSLSSLKAKLERERMLARTDPLRTLLCGLFLYLKGSTLPLNDHCYILQGDRR